MNHKIIAGSVNDICKESGDWVIVDIGFSKNDPTCGVWTDASGVEVVTFDNLVRKVIQEAAGNEKSPPNPPPLNLLLEAPLSVAFVGNHTPTRRRCDERKLDEELRNGGQKKEYRDWYYNAGAATLLAAGYLLRVLYSCDRQRKVRLFEGFVSFKRSKPKNKAEAEKRHKKDVLDLKDVVWDPTKACYVTPENVEQTERVPARDRAGACIFYPQVLNQNEGDRVVSAFAFAGMAFGVPPVIRIIPD